MSVIPQCCLYDLAGNRTAKTNQLTDDTEQYAYDSLYQPTQVTQGALTTESYAYDQVGNRVSSLGQSPYTYNVSNELLTTPEAGFTYDANGNTSSKTDASGTTQYQWDFENRLIGANLPGGGGARFKYDPFGRRIQNSAGAQVTNYLYDGANVVAELDLNGNIAARYTQGPGIDEPLAMWRNGVIGYYEQDGLGSITSLSGNRGTLMNTYIYSAFGKSTAAMEMIPNPFQFISRDYDSETGLGYYRARYYDSSTGRFLSEDPIGFADGSGFYRYVHNNPIIYIDPTGFKSHGWGTGPPDPSINTTVCNGHGGIGVQIGNAGSPQEALCLEDCMRVHEQRHVADALAAAPNVCKGKKAGVVVGPYSQSDLNATEIAASTAEIDCLEKKQEKACPACKEIIKQRIKQMKGYRDRFKTK